MATKTIAVSREAYEKLKRKKKDKESFTDVVERLTSKKPLTEITGILSNEEGKELREKVKERREDSRERIDKVKGRLRE